MTAPEERKAYVRGLMTAFIELGTDTDLVTHICEKLGVTSDELMALRESVIAEAAFRRRSTPFVPGVLGEGGKR